jgi:PAS domain S-box-containing protein
MLLGSLTIVGWQHDIALFVRPVDGTVAMNPLTALCFVLCGLSLVTFSKDSWRALSSVTASLVIFLALLKLMALVLGSSFTPDAVLFASKLDGEVDITGVNRMAPNTALCFLLSGVSLLLYRFSNDTELLLIKWAELFAMILFLLAVVPLLGYVYEIKEFYGVLSYIPMAVHTAIGFMLYATALLFANPKGRFMAALIGTAAGSYVLRLLLPFALLGPIALGMLRVTSQRAGLFSPEFGTMMHVTLEIIILILLIWKVAIEVNWGEKVKLQAEQNMAEHNSKLEQRVRERTDELHASMRELADKETRYRQLADRFTAMVAASNTGAWEFNEETGFLWCSNEYFTMLGYDPRAFDLSGAPNMKQVWTDLLHPEDRLKPDPHFSESLRKEGIMYENSFRMRHADGHYLWILSRGRTLTDENGNPTPITVGTHIDITARKQAEELLAMSEERYRTLAQRFGTLIAASKTGAWEYNTTTAEGWFSREYYSMLGYKDEHDPELQADDARKMWIGLIHPDDRDVAREKFRAYLREPVGMYENIFRMRHKSGDWIWVWSRGRTLTDQNGKYGTLTVGTHIDITERKEAEERLAKSEERFRHALDNMMEGIQIIDRDCRYVYVNDAVTAHARLSADQLLGRTMMECYPGFEDTKVYGLIRKCIEQGESFHFDNEFTFASGEVAYFDMSIQPVPQGVFILSIETTERKKAELKVRQFNEELERTIEERTSQLKSVNKELEAFSYSVSHDLRAPLRAVNGFSEMVQQQYGDKLDDNGRRLLGIIRDNATTMGQLIDDLLEFSRTGRKELSFMKVDMNQLANEALTELQQQQSVNASQVVIEPLPVVMADRQLMKQVMVNLLSNALKYSSKKEAPLIRVWSEQAEEGITFHVSDNGVGFDMAYVDKLFGVFQRLHSKREFEGTGVGLALVQRIIARHGGRVWAEGIVGEGATFHFTVPERGVSIAQIHHGLSETRP